MISFRALVNGLLGSEAARGNQPVDEKLSREKAVREKLAESLEPQFWFQQNPSNELRELFDLHGSDKGTTGATPNPFPWAQHTYADVYGVIFEHCRGTVKSVFECGLGTNNVELASNMTASGRPGASLRAWRDYFPEAAIVGADIDKAVLFREERIETYFVDQTDPESVSELWDQVTVDNFDLMVDDGLHEFEAGMCLLVGSWAKLRVGGVYVIEDVSVGDLIRYREAFERTNQWVAYIQLARFPSKLVGGNSLVILRKMRDEFSPLPTPSAPR